MKLHKGLVDAVLFGMKEIFIDHRHADQVVDELLKSNKKWGKRDRSFIAENIYDTCRWWSLITFCAGKTDALVQSDMKSIFYTWLILKSIHLGNEPSSELPEWVMVEDLTEEMVKEHYAKAVNIRSVIHAIPEWLDKVGVKELNEKWVTELMGQNCQAPLYIRVNPLKSSIKQVREILGFEETETLSGVPFGLMLKKRQNLMSRDSFQMGFFEIQDAGSQLIAPFLNPQPGDFVVDACAGAGGKSLHFAALLEGKGRILAMDIERVKLMELEKRAKRNGATNLRTQLITGESTISSLYNQVDKLLLDVPCTGLGVLRRSPDSKWKLTQKFLDQIRQTQAELLSNYSKMVKIGGNMVYATCSILPSESEWQVSRFIGENVQKWKLVKEHRTSPYAENVDGFYMALLERIA